MQGDRVLYALAAASLWHWNRGGAILETPYVSHPPPSAPWLRRSSWWLFHILLFIDSTRALLLLETYRSVRCLFIHVLYAPLSSMGFTLQQVCTESQSANRSDQQSWEKKVNHRKQRKPNECSGSSFQNSSPVCSLEGEWLLQRGSHSNDDQQLI